MERRQSTSGSVYNALHGDSAPGSGTGLEMVGNNDTLDKSVHDLEEEDDDYDVHHQHHHKHAHKKEVVESFDFIDNESMMWRKVRC
jgi:hypothetical protein